MMQARGSRQRWVGKWMAAMALCFSLSGAIGCEKSAREHLAVAESALQKGEADRAEAELKTALDKDPKLEEAKLRMTQVHMLRKQYDKAEQSLDAFWKEHGLDGENLPTDKKVKKSRLEAEYQTLYRQWAESIDAKANPQKFEEIVKKGLEFNKSDTLMNTMLVNHYLALGEQLIEQGKKKEAAETFDKIYPLYTSSKTRNESQDRAEKLRKEVYATETAVRFEKEHKPKLVEAERWDEEKKTILFQVEGEYDRNLDDEQAKALALQAVSQQMNGLVLQVGAMPADTNVGAAHKLEGVTVVEEEIKRGNYKLVVSAPLDTLMDYTMLVNARHEAAKKKAAEKKGKEGGEGGEAKDKPAEEGKGEKPAEGDAADGGEKAADGEKPAEAKEGEGK